MEKRCTKCGETKPETEFYRRKTGSRYTACRACCTAYQAQRRRSALVPIAPFTARYLQLKHDRDLTLSELAVRMGWTVWVTKRPDGHPREAGDNRRISRTLGLRVGTSCSGGRRYHSRQQRCRYDTALLLAEALHMDPHEWEP